MGLNSASPNGRKQGRGCWGCQPLRTSYGVWGSAVSSPSGVRGGVLPVKRGGVGKSGHRWTVTLWGGAEARRPLLELVEGQVGGMAPCLAFARNSLRTLATEPWHSSIDCYVVCKYTGLRGCQVRICFHLCSASETGQPCSVICRAHFIVDS